MAGVLLVLAGVFLIFMGGMIGHEGAPYGFSHWQHYVHMALVATGVLTCYVGLSVRKR